LQSVLLVLDMIQGPVYNLRPFYNTKTLGRYCHSFLERCLGISKDFVYKDTWY